MNFTQTENQTSPLLSLPVEIICSIFHWACSEPSPFTTSGLGESPRTEIALSHVCHQWRYISLAHPVLWTLYCGYVQPGKIASSTEYSSSKAKKFSFEELDAYLERSSQLPLDLWLDFSDPDRIDYPELALDMITDAKHAARWRRVSLRLHEEWALENLLDPLRKVAAPLLQSFEVEIITAPITGSTRTPVGFFWEDDDDMPVPMDVQLHNPFLGGTRLTHVRIDARVFKSFAPCLANVTTLYIEGRRTYTAACSWSTFLSLIASPCLTSLSLFGLIFHPPSANTIPLLDDGERKALVRTNLKHLRTMDPIVAKYMWFYLDAPSLELLIFADMFVPFVSTDFATTVAIDPKAYGNIASRSFPSIQILAFIMVYTSEESLPFLTFLASATQSTTHLIIIDGSDTTGIYQSMMECTPPMPDASNFRLATSTAITQRQPQILWPNLSKFTCDVCRWALNLGDRWDDATACAVHLEYRAAVLRKPCLLLVFDQGRVPGIWKKVYEARWKDWSSKSDSKPPSFETIKWDDCDDNSVPWPPREDEVLGYNSEVKFIIGGYTSLTEPYY